MKMNKVMMQMVIKQMDSMLRDNPDRAEALISGALKNITQEEVEKAKPQFEEVYRMAKKLKCENVIAYLDKMRDELKY